MYKDEMIQLHQFLVYILKYLAENDQIKNDCSEYISLKIKAEHKHAIFVLCKIIAQVINEKDKNSIPDNVCNSLADLVKRSQNDIKMD